MLGKASKEHSFNDTTAGTVLLSAAVFDDVSGLVMARFVLTSPQNEMADS